jgi:hemolysin III
LRRSAVTVAAMEALPAKPLLRGWSHAVAFIVVAVLGVVLLATADASASRRVWLAIYVAGTLTMFGVSALYHRGRWQPRARAAMRRLDHSAIFLAIAGAYTPIMAVTLDGWRKPVVLFTVWGGAIVGLVLEWLPMRVPRPVFTAIYVIVGWSAALAFGQLADRLGAGGFLLMLGGGLLYTIGAVIYAVKRPDRWPAVFGFHEVFHAFTVAGAGCHLAAIAFYVVPLM